jgi:hypothetical protein
MFHFDAYAVFSSTVRMDYMYASDLIVVTPSKGTCQIPNNPKAKLIYYLYALCS